MAKKDTAQYKGDQFEELVYKRLKQLLQEQCIPGVTQHHEIFLHKPYESKTPGVVLNPDITIEVYPDDTIKRWSLLFVIECKNHKRKIDFTTFKGFVGDLTNYSRNGVRGIMISSVGFSQEVINSADYNNIALGVINEDTDWNWIIRRQINNWKLALHFHQALRGNEVSQNPFVYSKYQLFSISDFLVESGIRLKNSLEIPYKSDKEIENIVSVILKKTNRLISATYIERCMEVVASDYAIIYEDMDEQCLGECDFETHTISVNASISKERQNFTIAHELGHIALHSKLVTGLKSVADNKTGCNLSISKQMHDRMEIQANAFASHLLLPSVEFFVAVAKLFREYRITTNRLYCDNQLCNQRECKMILGNLAQQFGVSREAIKVRLKNANLYEEEDFAIRIDDIKY